jgi:hypothetical protein
VNDLMGPGERGDEAMSDDDRRIAGLLASVHAEPNPAVWTRVRTRLAAAGVARTARTPLDAFLDWLTRPAALAAATATLVVALGTGWSVLGTITAPTAGDEFVSVDATSLMESLLDASDIAEDEADAAVDGDDSAAPRDSGGRS